MLLWLTTLDNARMSERISSLGRRSARQKVAHLFCDLLVRLAGVGLQSGLGYHLPLTQEVMADTLGLTPVHINRVLQGLRREGMIELRDHALAVRDWPALKNVA
jgi:CRP-like cAMP-binding protein